jgi:hypothetical protein
MVPVIGKRGIIDDNNARIEMSGNTRTGATGRFSFLQNGATENE